MKLQEYYNLLKENEFKIPIIDKITERHPGYGAEFGWSTYTGGMVDSGSWNVEKLLTVPLQTLIFQEEKWAREEEQVAKQREEFDKLSPKEKLAVEEKQWMNWKDSMEKRLLWGK